MNGRTIAQILLVIVLAFGAVALGAGAYNAGLSAGLAQSGTVTVAPGAYAVAPYAGWGHFWFFPFGFLGGLLFLFLFLGLIRAAFGSRRGWGGWGGYGRGWYGPGSASGYGPGPGFNGDRDAWEARAREAHDAWHRAHPDQPGSTGPSGPGGQPTPGGSTGGGSAV